MAFQLYLLFMPEDLVALVVCSPAQDHRVSPETVWGWATGAVQHPAGEATLKITEACTFELVRQHGLRPDVYGYQH